MAGVLLTRQVVAILAPMLSDLHGLIMEGVWEDAPIGERWRATFASRPQAEARGRAPLAPDLVFRLALAGEAPSAPSGPPDFEQGELLAYYVQGAHVVAHFPRYGQLRLDLSRGATEGVITRAALATHGVFEDLLAMGLSPHLRRRGMFLIHAFAAACPPLSANLADGGGGRGVGVLLVGDIGAGKTTTGLALLHAGWKLLSNDSPILISEPARRPKSPDLGRHQEMSDSSGHAGRSPKSPDFGRHREMSDSTNLRVLSYPGLLSAYPDTLARFPELRGLNSLPEARQKVLFAAESVYPEVWADSAPPGAIIFPQVESRSEHALERLSAPEALRLILPHAVEQWDREMIPVHLALLNQLVQAAPAYRLRLGPDTGTIPATLASALV